MCVFLAMKATKSLAFAVLLYAALVWVAVTVHPAMIERTVVDSFGRSSAYAMAGPALALFTHTSFILFPFASFFVLPWLIGAFVSTTWRRYLYAPIFVISWLAVGRALMYFFEPA